MKKLVHGVGVYNKGKYVSRIDNYPSLEYSKWLGMLQRCYSIKCQTKYPSYVGCVVCENFLDFQYFAEWCNNQIGFKDGYQLDKDLLIKGNKIYSEETCVFVPREINMFLTSATSARGNCGIGVYFDSVRNNYKSCISIRDKPVYLGRFTSQEDAFYAYKLAKEQRARDLAEEFKGRVDVRVIQALDNFEVNVND